ncbi:DUF2057 domain-containing protein [Parasalinivibrio latis]|uniref:YccT family protein n=1 Tax=Parasalinivibrio latis TaxID=2952610 RepID=UPI0030E30E58
MKLIKIVALAGILLGSMSSYAAVTVKLHQDLEPMIINGEELGFTLGKRSEIDLENGTNQIVVRVSKLVQHQAEFDKFRSYPVVLTFDANNKELLVEPSQIITRQDQAKEFELNPEVVVKDSVGKTFAVHQGVLMPGKGITRNYEKELDTYNQAHNYNFNTEAEALAVNKAAENKKPVVSTNTVKATPAVKTNTSPEIKSDGSFETQLLKKAFLDLPVEDKKAFMLWAMDNING